MHSWTFRLNAIFTFTVTVLAVLSALNALSVAFLNPQPVATIDNVKLQRLPGSGSRPPAVPFRALHNQQATSLPPASVLFVLYIQSLCDVGCFAGHIVLKVIEG